MEGIAFIIGLFLFFKLVSWIQKDDKPKNQNRSYSSQSTTRPTISSNYPPPTTRPTISSNYQSPTTSETINLAIRNGKDVLIDYQNYDGEISRRRLSNLSINNGYSGYHNAHIKAYCHKRNEERSFKIARIISAQIVD